MIQEARQLRQRGFLDPNFRSYSSRAQGYVHFFLHREDTDERILVKTDQIALEVYWQAPDRTRQRIVGLRDEKSLPTNIRYHLDHLVVVQDEFGDRIRIGDGDEIESVLHPAAPGADSFYDYLLADSVTLTLPGKEEAVRVYEVQVRPKDPALPAFLGSLFLDRNTRAIARMSFTFTPASYVDPYLDHIRISLENGLWEGRWWLPYRQELEIRREVPWLDIPAGSIIKGWFEVGEYRINPELSPGLFLGPRITTLPEARRRAYPFPDSLHAHLDEMGFSPPPAMEEIEALALELARDRYLSGLRKLRLHLPDPLISSGLRYNRSEGLFLGGGASYGLNPFLGLAAHGGFSFGRERPSLALTLNGGERAPGTHLQGYWNRPVDLGPVPAISGILNTLGTLLLCEDHQDLYFATGVRAAGTLSPWKGAKLTLSGRWDEHRRGRDQISSDPSDTSFRPVLGVERGRWRSADLHLTAPLPIPFMEGQIRATGASFEKRKFGILRGAVGAHHRWLTRGYDARLRLEGGTLLGGDPPLQAHFLLGGRETLPGYPFRSLLGDRYWLLRAETSRDIYRPWVRFRTFAAAGGTRFRGTQPPPPWPRDPSPGTRISLGAGLALGWDILRLDLARGIRAGGRWDLVFSVNHAFWGWL